MRKYLIFHLRHDRVALFGMILALVFIVMALFAPLIASHDPERSDPRAILDPPSGAHWFGTDINGTDIFARVVHGAKTDLIIASLGTAFSFILGSLIGVAIAYLSGRRGIGGWFAEGAMRVADVVQAFPVFVLALALVSAAGNSLRNIILAIAFLNIPVYMRLVRARGLAVRESTYIEAARCAGYSDVQVVRRFLLPNSLAPALAQVSVNFGWAIMLTAGLSFVGAGVASPTPEWGLMVAVGSSNMITGQWWPSVFPGIAIALAVLAFQLVGEAFEHVLDPTRRG